MLDTTTKTDAKTDTTPQFNKQTQIEFLETLVYARTQQLSALMRAGQAYFDELDEFRRRGTLHRREVLHKREATLRRLVREVEQR